jgi:hypothetical protein
MTYTCNICNYTTKYKKDFIRHLNRKNKCDEEDLVYNYKDYNSTEYKYICDHCNKEFTRKDSLKRHLKNRCKFKKAIKETKEDIKDKLEDMLVEMSEMKKLIKNQKQIVNETKINNNIMVNNFGSENIDYITEKVLNNIMSYPKSSIPKLIKQIHFNPNHPENHNIRIKNKKLKYAEVKENNEWKLKHKRQVLDDLVDFGYITLEDHKENIESEEMDDLLIKGFNKLMKGFNDNKIKKEIMKDVELEVLNGSNELNL